MKLAKTYILILVSFLLLYSFTPSPVSNAPDIKKTSRTDTIVKIVEENDDTTTVIHTDTVMSKNLEEVQETDTTGITTTTDQPPVNYNKYKFYIPKSTRPLTRNLSNPNNPQKGLDGRHIALWQSHGLYYKQSQEKWVWQRANIFETREDLYTQSYVLPFLVPMLENAGANVLLPRERDIQTAELIVDNDRSSFGCEFLVKNGRYAWQKGFGTGFAKFKDTYRQGENPFRSGSFMQVTSASKEDAASTAEWTLDIPKDGMYAVYVSYKTLPNSANEAIYTVFHAGGETQFAVNQTMGGGTWIYLGQFQFEKGKSKQAKVMLSNISSDAGKLITADAIKVGGGMGNISRKRSDLVTKTIIKVPLKKRTKKGKRRYRTKTVTNVKHFYNYSTSNMPRFTEGARYWLQWAGAPDSVYSRTNAENDYSDDFQSRGFWVNYLAGGSVSVPKGKGLNIPIDMAFAFHTDAGKTSDSIIGTLAIHTVKTKEGGTVYNNGISRWVGRDLTDKIQTQIVTDIHRLYDNSWVRRQLWNRNYAESRTPEVPTMLLELLSHQNFPDMRYGQDPRFRFHVSRAIYKGIIRYLAFTNNFDYVIQPLPVEAFSAEFADTNMVKLQWKPVNDPLEATAKPTGYIVYTRIGDGGFDNGEYVGTNTLSKKIDRNTIYSFKVEAVNDGGKSFPSEILSVYKAPKDTSVVLIVNAFNRISAPASFDSYGIAGFNKNWDAGVPYINDYKFTGYQTEFRKYRPYLSDDNPGHGTSEKGWEGKVIAGNTFDYPYLHGKSIQKAGLSFVSCSEKAVTDGDVKMYKYPITNLIQGKERQWTSLSKYSAEPVFKTFVPELQKAIIQTTDSGKSIFISGAHVVSDLVMSEKPTVSDVMFLERTLKVKWTADKINNLSNVSFLNSPVRNFAGINLSFYTSPNSESYFVEAPDLVIPSDSNAYQIGEYSQNLGAGVAYRGKYNVCTLGFPFETIVREEDRDRLMRAVLQFLTAKKE